MFLENFGDGPGSANASTSSIPSALARWSEEGQVLDPLSIHYCVASVKPDILPLLEQCQSEALDKARTEDKKKKAEAEAKAAAAKKEEEEKKKKQEQEKEKEKEKEKEQAQEEAGTSYQSQAAPSTEDAASGSAERMDLTDVLRLKPKQIENYYKLYQTKLGQETADGLMKSGLEFGAKLLSKFITIDDVDSLVNDVRQDVLVRKELINILGMLALKGGRSVALVSGLFHILKHASIGESKKEEGEVVDANK